MVKIHANPIKNRADWEKHRRQAETDPGQYHGEIAKRMLYWFDPAKNVWLKYFDNDNNWHGFNALTGKQADCAEYSQNYFPWELGFDDTDAPFYKWFIGGQTNACFNEVDAHVLAGYGDEVAFYFEGDRWDSSLFNGKGGPVQQMSISRKQLMFEVALCAQILINLGLKRGDRIALNMPNVMEQIYFIEAAKRLGIIYTCVFGGYSAKTLSDRIHDAGAKVVITTDGAYRNAQVISFKEQYTDKAIQDYIPAKWGIDIVANLLKQDTKLDDANVTLIINAVQTLVTGELTVERADIMHGVGIGFEKISNWDAALKSKIRTEIAEALVNSPPRVERVIVIQHTHNPDLTWRSETDAWYHDLRNSVLQEFIQTGNKKHLKIVTETDILHLELDDFIQLIYSMNKPIPVPADYPLFIIYTSGSTGKPKGVVHTHGGYVAGIAYTMQISFDIPANPPLNQGKIMYTVADPGWITGQSYMICASLTTRTTSIITEGSPVFPNAGRFASIIERYKVNVFKAGSTFLKSIGTDPGNIADIQHYDVSSLEVATFCAEPTSPTIQEFAMQLLTPNYINSYWSTEHGGIILTHFFGNEDFMLKADAHTYPLPWIFCDVWVPENNFEINGKTRSEYRQASSGEKGEIVVTKPFPYLARTIWGDADNVLDSKWQGDIERFKQIYFNNWAKKGTNGNELIMAYTQGDFACSYPDGGISLHGRSDDVINTSGHRIGTEEIEGAILKDKQLNPNSVVGNVIVVGAPHKDKGTVPLAFILTSKGNRLSIDDEQRLDKLVREEKGIVAVPAGYITVSQFPETRSGKYMRRYLRKMLENEDLGDISTLRNPEVLKEIEQGIQKWRARADLENEHNLLQVFATVRVEIHEIAQQKSIAIVTISRPPVNSLDERTLDELVTVILHLKQRDDIAVIILTGDGAKSFVAGADVRQMLEEMNTTADVLPLPHQANLLIDIIEKMSKPVIAAVNGIALGGGNELQMACHYRIAEKFAKFAQPEINLNLMPGYGGTQRLLRLIELTTDDKFRALLLATRILLNGRTLTAEEALELGLINEISIHEDVVTRAVEIGKEYILNANSKLKQIHDQRLKLLADWDKPRVFPQQDFYNSEEIQQYLNQARFAQRESPVQWILEALRCGYEQGITKGIERETELFAQAVIDPNGGKKGIRAFFDRQSKPLPIKKLEHLEYARAHEAELLANGQILPFGAAFYPGFSKIPKYQYAYLVEKDPLTGAPLHGDPIDCEVKRIIPVEEPSSVEALLYMLSSEINFNDIWAITGVPVSPFDSHDQDWHVTGSGGLALVVEVGEEVKKEGRIKVGDLVVIFSGQSELLSPIAGLDPMFAEQHIQGYEIPNGSHQQFMLAQAPQLHYKVADLSLEAAGCYILNLGTIYRALFTTLHIESGKTMFIEGAATGTGAEAVKAAVKSKLNVVGLVSSASRAADVITNGARGAINRTDPAFEHLFTKVPEDPAQWQQWEQAGTILINQFRNIVDGSLADYVISHAGELAFPRSFQLLAQNGTLTFYGASSGYHFTFMGKEGVIRPEHMLQRVNMQIGASVVIFYGVDPQKTSDPMGLEIIEACREHRAKIVVCTYTEAQANFIKSMGYGDAIVGVISIEDMQRKEGDLFVWPKTMPALPDSKTQTDEFKEAVRWYQEYVFKPFASSVGKLLKSSENPKGQPDIVFERADQDMLCLSVMLVKSYTGKVVYCENMQGKRYSFYAPQLWMRQRRIYMPTANIWGTHLHNSYEVQKMDELINAGFLQVSEPLVVNESGLAHAHQDMWENKHRGANYVFNHAIPQTGLKTKDDLYHAWALQDKKDT